MKKLTGRSLVATLRQHEIRGFSYVVDRPVIVGVAVGTPAGLLDTQLANDTDLHDAAQIQRFPPPQV
jgi:hypothetical protein